MLAMNNSLIARGLTKLGMILACTSILLIGCQRSTPQANKAAKPKVTVAEVKKSTVPIVATSNGTTRSINEVTIRARVKGFLKERLFKEGANVKSGELLLIIDEEPFKVKLAEANAKLSEAAASLRKAEQSKAIEIAQAQLALDQATAGLAQVEVGRERSLYARKATPLEEVDRKEAQLKRSTAQVDSSKASLDQAKADYDINIAAAKSNVDKAKAEVRNAEIELGYCRMTSPIDGRIGELLVKVGNLVGNDASTELVTIRQLDPMGFDVRPSSRYLPRINRVVAAGIPVTFQIQAEESYEHSGKVVFIDNQIDPATSTVLLKAETPNPDQSLLPGEYIKTRCVVGEYKDAIVIPEKALIEGQAGFSVFVVDDSQKVIRVSVTPLDTVDGVAVIESGLSEGQRVIVGGIQLVRQGAEVDPVNATPEPIANPKTEPTIPTPPKATEKSPETKPK